LCCVPVRLPWEKKADKEREKERKRENEKKT
jgi:hypothetical protein